MALGLALLGACAPDEREPASQTRAPAAKPGQAGEAGGDLADSAPVNVNQAWITDANALALLSVLNSRQIDAANVELDAWHTDTVKTFAVAVAHDHAQFQHTTDSVAEHLHLAPVRSALVVRIDSIFHFRIDSLRGLHGPQMERAFVQQQVVAEQDIATYADELTGATQAPEVRALMQAAANGARARVNRARAVAATLAIADSMKSAKTTDSLARAEARHRRHQRDTTPNRDTTQKPDTTQTPDTAQRPDTTQNRDTTQKRDTTPKRDTTVRRDSTPNR